MSSTLLHWSQRKFADLHLMCISTPVLFFTLLDVLSCLTVIFGPIRQWCIAIAVDICGVRQHSKPTQCFSWLIWLCMASASTAPSMPPRHVRPADQGLALCDQAPVGRAKHVRMCGWSRTWSTGLVLSCVLPHICPRFWINTSHPLPLSEYR